MMAQELEASENGDTSDHERSSECDLLSEKDQRGADGGGQAGTNCGSLRSRD